MSPKTYSAMGDPKSITELIMGQRPHAFTGELMTCVICGATERSGTAAAPSTWAGKDSTPAQKSFRPTGQRPAPPMRSPLPTRASSRPRSSNSGKGGATREP